MKTLDISRGDQVALVGDNASGKSRTVGQLRYSVLNYRSMTVFQASEYNLLAVGKTRSPARIGAEDDLVNALRSRNIFEKRDRKMTSVGY